jgi:hypothetical protein
LFLTYLLLEIASQGPASSGPGWALAKSVGNLLPLIFYGIFSKIRILLYTAKAMDEAVHSISLKYQVVYALGMASLGPTPRII